MKRREFLKLAAGATAAAMCPLKGCAHPSPSRQRAYRRPGSGPSAKVFLAGTGTACSEQAVKLAVRACAEAATDFSWLSRGDAVFIKPVVNSGNPYPATTSPIAVAAMIELLREKGAGRVVVGDMSGVEHVRFSPAGCSGSSRALMESSGLARAVTASGAELYCFEEAGWEAFHEEAPAAGSHWKNGLMMPDILSEIQHIVLMPRCGRHVLAGSTLGLKAAVGYWRHDTRLEYHRDASTFSEKTAEGNTVESLRTKQRLVITAADMILATFGPDEGYVCRPENGLVIASESVVAHDMVSLAWLLENRRIMPASEKDGFMDTSSIVPRVGNHMVVNWLGGLRQALASEAFVKEPLATVWDDPVLDRAFDLFGGVPEVVLEAADDAVPEELKLRLGQMTTAPV
ncbi:MAG: hypothetical protein BWZ01_00929 [Deltaproteobacteria bacterium ADurb.BinA179]|nr:DUF362 domain-containing protein [Bacteriovoracaceae bacterium]OPZ28890.1 MAG: hypothetical protein BWZ01_00929 [Deltaproteobacteria bacterium ADurb.BinA179]HOD71502.1 DUF362 domain-containing protein [Deltaproteobacteria bacterium]HRR21524.1 DUF362 domain-containing protein [Desulfomonilia bacterium]HOE73282.1 DUF362 domain-containing protein [Deltaproteobacteria bacterium]